MLTAEENEILTRIGPGTRMGSLLRRYWQPVAYSDGFVSHIRRQMSHFSPIAEELIDMFTKDRGSRESARAAE